MKALMITLCVAGLLALVGCDDTAKLKPVNNGNDNGSVDGNGNGNGDNGGNTGDLQSYVLNNCGAVTDGEPAKITGQFPEDTTTDPTQSVYTKNCLGGSN